MWTTKLFERLGLNRDSLALFVSKWVAFIVALAPMGVDVTRYGIPASWVPYIQLAALFISVSSAQHRTSGLLNEADTELEKARPESKRIVPAVLLACALAAGSLSACASVPVKQRAVQAVQVSEMALEAAHDAERALAVTGVIAPARHREIAVVFVRAFDLEIKVATGLKLWRAGDPPPAALADYQRDLAEILAYARTLSADPRAQTFISQAQAAVEKAVAIAQIVGVR